MINQSSAYKAHTVNKGVITDVEEKDDPYILNMPYDEGKDYLTIYNGDAKEIHVKRSADGYVGYKTGINFVEEESGDVQHGVNEGTIDFRGERSMGIYVYIPHQRKTQEIKNRKEILLSGKNSYGIKIAHHAKNNSAIENTGLIHLRKNPDGVDKADNSIGIALVKDDTIKNGVYFGRNKAINKDGGEIKLTDVENSTGVYVNINSNITNQGKITIGSTISKAENPNDQKYNYGMRSDGETTAEVINDNTGIISLDGSYAYGLITKGSQIKNRGKITSTNISNGVGIAALAEGTDRGKVENSEIGRAHV